MSLEPGWLARVFYDNTIAIALWPDYLRDAAGFTDEKLTNKQRREVIDILRKRIEELENGYKDEDESPR